MAGIQKLREVYTQFKNNRTLEGERSPIEDQRECAHELSYFMDSFLPNQDEGPNDIYPGEGQVTVPFFQGAGTFTGQYSGDSQSGQATSSYSDGLQMMSRQLYFEEGSADSLSLHLTNNGYEEIVTATHHHLDRENPENSYQVSQHWHVSPWSVSAAS